MSNEAEIAELMTHAELDDNSGGIQTWRVFVDNSLLRGVDRTVFKDGTHLLEFGTEEWQAKEYLHHQVRRACGWKRVIDHYEKE